MNECNTCYMPKYRNDKIPFTFIGFDHFSLFSEIALYFNLNKIEHIARL